MALKSFDDVELVGWCFSRRTLRRGRMITCRAQDARCTRKPSPRPLQGWLFPKLASKFSLTAANTCNNNLLITYSYFYLFFSTNILYLDIDSHYTYPFFAMKKIIFINLFFHKLHTRPFSSTFFIFILEPVV